MRNVLGCLLVAFAALGSTEAWAQYQNRSIGFSAGYWDLQESEGLDRAIPIGLAATTYFDMGIEGTAHTHFALVQEPVQGRFGLGFSITAGARYLFLQGEKLRPYAGLHVSYFHAFMEVGAFQLFGVGPNAGVEYFITDSMTIGVRGQYNLFLRINEPLQTSLGLTAELSFWY